MAETIGAAGTPSVRRAGWTWMQRFPAGSASAGRKRTASGRASPDGQFARVRVQDGALWADCPAAEDGFWRRYFALDMDYGAIQAQFAGSKRLAECVAAAPGLRVLRQPFFEVLCTFLISQNNNIPRIRGIVARLCALCGEELARRAARFPHPGSIGRPDAGIHGGAGGPAGGRITCWKPPAPWRRGTSAPRHWPLCPCRPPAPG